MKKTDIGLEKFPEDFHAIPGTMFVEPNVKKQYRYYETATFKYNIDVYHDGKRVNTIIAWLDDLDGEIYKLQLQGYTFGFTEQEAILAKQQYERILNNLIKGI